MKFIQLSIGLLILFCFRLNAQVTAVWQAEKLANEVYANTEYLSDVHMQGYREKLDRTVLEKIDANQPQEYTLLSAVRLKDKYNNFKRDKLGEAFDPSLFNPLKYGLNFYPETVVYYRIDGSDYFIKIMPGKSKQQINR